jgi:glucokinase
MSVLVFDIGGTKMRFGISADGKKLDRYLKVPTPQDFEEAMSTAASMVSELSEGTTISACAGGIAGTLEATHSSLTRSPHLPKFVDHPLREKLELISGVSVRIENDAAMVGLGEAVVGAGKGFEIVSYITVSTGVGGSRIIDGVIDRSVRGFEPGHQVIDADGNLCPECAKPGDLENYISGTAVMKRFNKMPKDIQDPKVWIQLADWLAYGLLNTTVHWSPHVIVLGGSMITGDPAISFGETQKKFTEIMKSFPEVPLIKKAELGDDGGLLGSLAYLLSKK